MTNKPQKQDSVEQYLNDAKPHLKKFAMDESLIDGVIKSAMLAIAESDELKKCLSSDVGKISLYQSLKYASATGLSLNPLEGKCALIAYNNKVQYQVMKNGLVELAMRSGKVDFITADTVRENDEWQITKGMNGDEYRFSPARTDRGNIEGFFAAIKMKDGPSSVFYMTKEEVEKHRDSYSSFFKNKPQASPWSHSFEGMAIKTVLKKLLKNISISSEMNAAVGADDIEEVNQQSGTTSDEALTALQEKDVTPPPENKENSDSMF